MNFSQRMGLQPAVKPFQKDAMDRDLRNGLWNCLELTFLPEMRRQWSISFRDSRLLLSGAIFVPLWTDFYKLPLGTMPNSAPDALVRMATWFHDEEQAPWNKVYEFVELIANITARNYPEFSDNFVAACNRVMRREFSAYRFVGTTLSPITNEAEIKTIEQAASMDTSPLAPVRKHTDTALKFLSDRKKPDYRNSIKESISAVEAVCCVIAGEKTTLGAVLKKIKDKVDLHPALEKGFSSLYGWTNDAGGIRHALTEDSIACDFEDAKYMLVSCSAFVNYLVEKAEKNGLLPK